MRYPLIRVRARVELQIDRDRLIDRLIKISLRSQKAELHNALQILQWYTIYTVLEYMIMTNLNVFKILQNAKKPEVRTISR